MRSTHSIKGLYWSTHTLENCITSKNKLWTNCALNLDKVAPCTGSKSMTLAKCGNFLALEDALINLFTPLCGTVGVQGGKGMGSFCSFTQKLLPIAFLSLNYLLELLWIIIWIELLWKKVIWIIMNFLVVGWSLLQLRLLQLLQ